MEFLWFARVTSTLILFHFLSAIGSRQTQFNTPYQPGKFPPASGPALRETLGDAVGKNFRVSWSKAEVGEFIRKALGVTAPESFYNGYIYDTAWLSQPDSSKDALHLRVERVRIVYN